MMSSTTSTSPPLDVDVEVLEDPDDARGVGRRAVARDRHEVDLARDRQVAHQVGHEEDRALEDADEQQVAAGVVGRDLGAELRDPPLERRPPRSGPLSTARSSSVADSLDLRVLDDPGHGDDLVAAHDERPLLALRARDLRVDEHVLDLLLLPAEPVAGPPPSYLKPWRAASGFVHVAPAHLAVERDRPALEPEPLVLAHRLEAAAEVDALRADGCREQLGERRRQRLAAVERAQEVLVGGRDGAGAAAAGSRRGSGRASCRAFDVSSRNGSPAARQ